MKEEYLSYCQIIISERVKSIGKDPVKYKPKMISIESDFIQFGMWKHNGVLTLPFKGLFCEN